MTRKYKLPEFPNRMDLLHLRCGEDVLGSLRQAGLGGDRLSWSDPLCEGPLCLRPGEPRARARRGAYLARRFGIPLRESVRRIGRQELQLRHCGRYAEVVLWFEADLFDQAILVYLLHRLAPLQRSTRISLICIGEYPGVRRFIGLGQLGPAQLARLFPTRTPVTRRQFELAGEAWRALCNPDPRPLQELSRRPSRALPFLPGALGRYLAEYPSTSNGLSRTAQLALEAIAAGAGGPREVFFRVQDREPRPFMGDTMFYAVLRELASGRRPALAVVPPDGVQLSAGFGRCTLRLTSLGQRLLAGRADRAGPARWMGGVWLGGPRPRWRWDAGRRRPVPR